MMRLKVLLTLIVVYTGCYTTPIEERYTKQDCISAYKLDKLYFDENDTLNFRLNIVSLLDKDNDFCLELYDSLFTYINAIYERHVLISFKKNAIIHEGYSKYLSVNDVAMLAEEYGSDTAITLYIFPDSKNDYTGAAADVPSKDFAVERAYVLTSTVAHELGHCLGLLHLHEPDTSATGYNSESGDKVCDTPKSIAYAQSISKLCSGVINGHTESESFVILHNILSYSYLHCRDQITYQQAQRIRRTVELNKELRKCMITNQKRRK